MAEQIVRNLAHLEESASTARVLNLLRIWQRKSRDPSYAQSPFFENPQLNQSIILKHRLRGHERDLFWDERRTATKVIFPIDRYDLKLGGRFVFVDQANYDTVMEGVFGEEWLTRPHDREILAHVDALPSLDPFLVREQLRRHNHMPARCYFDISSGDLARMVRFVESEVQKLIDLCYEGGSNRVDPTLVTRLVKKILSDTVDAETEPLRQTLRLERPEYQEGVFSWKGFLYYKWSLSEAYPNVKEVLSSIGKARPRYAPDRETRNAMEASREAVKTLIERALKDARRSLNYYDEAFTGLLEGRPQGFRDFLLRAPAMFFELGERLGAINMIVSYWKFRCPRGRVPELTGQELLDLFTGFERSLAFAGVAAREAEHPRTRAA